MRTSVRSVSEIEPALLAEPVQSPVTNAAPITITRNDYRYEVTPVAEYQLTGLIVHALNYSWFSIDRSEKAFPVDACVIWGDNLLVMASLLKDFAGKVDLIYIDPPFDSGADYVRKVTLRGATGSAKVGTASRKVISATVVGGCNGGTASICSNSGFSKVYADGYYSYGHWAGDENRLVGTVGTQSDKAPEAVALLSQLLRGPPMP